MKDIIVTVCAFVGAVLGVINFVKSSMKDRKAAHVKADQRWLEAKCRRAQTETGLRVSETYVVNSGPHPVAEVVARFFANDPPEAEPVSVRNLGNLSPGEEFHICYTGPGEPGYKCVEFTYVDVDGCPYRYRGAVICQPQ